jgi:hypothetical protein
LEAGVAVKDNVYLSDKIEVEFQPTDRSRAELAARLLRLAGVTAEVEKEESRDTWYVVATTDVLAAEREKLRNALAEFVREALARGWVDADKAERRLEKLEGDRGLMEGWPKYKVRQSGSGALEVKYQSTDPDSIQHEAQRLREMGLVEGVHFTVKMPEGGGMGYVRVLREGLAYAARLSVYGSGRQRDLAARFVEHILRRAEEAGEEVYEKVREVIDEGRARGSLTLKGFEKEVEVDDRRYVVKVIDGSAEFDEGRGGRKLLRIKITAEVDSVKSEYTITFGRYGRNAAVGFAVARGSAPSDREAIAERFSVLIKVLTGRVPTIIELSNGEIMIECGRGAPSRLHALCRACRCRREVAGGDGAVRKKVDQSELYFYDGLVRKI